MRRIMVISLIITSCIENNNKILANDIQITNVKLVGDNPSEGFIQVEFDISWENSWRTTFNTANWDAAWLFVKFREDGGLWRHAWLSNDGHKHGSGIGSIIDPGLKDETKPYDSQQNPVIGVTVYRNTVGSGSFSVSKMQLRWNYGTQGVKVGSTIEIRIYGVEMVYVPEGPFWVGDGNSRATLRQKTINTPVQILADGSTLKVSNSVYDDEQLKGAGIWVSGMGGISKSSSEAEDVNPYYPTGYRGYYCMKYEISQGQYRDFLNTLTRVQQQNRVRTEITFSVITERYVMSNSIIPQNRNGLRCDSILAEEGPIEIYCDLDGDGKKNEANDGEWIACNFLRWSDGIAFLDWSGLRPMTELEFEKACRGPKNPIAGEFSWGSSLISDEIYTLNNQGEANENIGENYSTTKGNVNYARATLNGPVRVGIFSANDFNNGRLSSGSGYYGIMELSGNLWERTVTLGNYFGRCYSGANGDGELDSQGHANVETWPDNGAFGSGFRGGSWIESSTDLQVSDRFAGSYPLSDGFSIYGFRGCRSFSIK